PYCRSCHVAILRDGLALNSFSGRPPLMRSLLCTTTQMPHAEATYNNIWPNSRDSIVRLSKLDADVDSVLGPATGPSSGDEPTDSRCNGNVNGLGDETLPREQNGAIWVLVAGAKFHVPDPLTLVRIFGGRAINDAPSQLLAKIGSVPLSGTLLREEN